MSRRSATSGDGIAGDSRVPPSPTQEGESIVDGPLGCRGVLVDVPARCGGDLAQAPPSTFVAGATEIH